jgi:hypothetical protein
MRSADFRAVVEPVLTEVFDGRYDMRANEYKQIFFEGPGIARSYHEEAVLYGFGAAPELPDGKPVTYDEGGTLYVQRYIYRVFGLAFALTRVLVQDGDHIRIGTVYSKHLANSMIETKETRCANVMNRAFNSSYVGGDGVALVVNNHPIIGGTASNLLTTAAVLSQTSLEQILIQIRNAVDSNGKKIRLKPKKIVCSPSQEFQAEVVTKSVLRTGSSYATYNDINPINSKSMLTDETAVISRLTSTTAWFVQTDAPEGLKVLTRGDLEKSMEGDFETDSIRYKSVERYAEGWTDWRAIYGTPGT